MCYVNVVRYVNMEKWLVVEKKMSKAVISNFCFDNLIIIMNVGGERKHASNDFKWIATAV